MRTIAIRRTAGLATALLLVIIFAVGVDQAVADPAGNNGTVKVDGVEFDSHPNNEPHVGCVFQVDFYGYDEGDLYADVTFTAQAPTQPAQKEILADHDIFIGEDPAGGGTDLDAERTYDLSASLGGFTAHDVQGYHIKLTVRAEGSIGADVKHKVFWVECQPTVPPTEPTVPPTEPTVPPTEPTVPPTEPTVPPTEPTVPPTEPTVPPTEPTVPPTEPTVPPTEPTTPEAEVVTTTTTIPPDVSSSSTSTSVAPSTTAAPTSSSTTATSPTTLPFTGVESDTMALMAFLALAAGAGLVGLTRNSVESQSDRSD